MKTPPKPSVSTLVKNTTRQLTPLIIGASALLLATSQHIGNTQSFCIIFAWSLSIASGMLAIFTLGAMIGNTETSPAATYTDVTKRYDYSILLSYVFFGIGLISYSSYGIGTAISVWTAILSEIPLITAVLLSMLVSIPQAREAFSATD